MSNEYLYALILTNIVLFTTGFLLGRANNTVSVVEGKPKSIFDSKKDKGKTTIQIDDKKIVTNINTNDLEKKYNQLGEQTHSTEDISSTINKLKNMKGS